MADDATGRDSDKFMLRLPDGMRDRLKAAAERNKRSMNAELVARLEASLEGDQIVTNVALNTEQARKTAAALKRAADFAEDLGGGIKFHFTVEKLEQGNMSDEVYLDIIKKNTE